MTLLTYLNQYAQEKTMTLIHPLSDYNYLFFTMSTGGGETAMSATAFVPRSYFTVSGRQVVLTYPNSNTHIICNITYVSNTQVKIKMSDGYRQVTIYGVN